MIAKHRVWIALGLLTLVAYGLRVVGAESSIAYISDTQLVRQAMEIGQRAAGQGQFDTDFAESFKYPLTLTLYLTGLYGAVYVGGNVIGVFDSVAGFQDYLFANREFIHLLAVYGFNLLSVMLIPTLYLASRQLKQAHSGWLVAGLGTFNLLLIHFGHQARPHVPLATLAFLSTVLLVGVAYNKGGWKVSLSATVLSALTVGTLQNGIVIILPFGLAWLLRAWDGDGYQWRELMRPLTIGNVLLFVILSLILEPQLIQEFGGVFSQFLSGEASSFELGGGTHAFSSSMFSVDNIPQFISNISSYQPILTLLLPIAIPYFIFVNRRKPRLLAVGLAFQLVNLVVWSLFEGNFPRITAVLSPFFIFVVGYLLEDIVLWLATKTDIRLAVVQFICFGAILVTMLVSAVRLVYVIGQPDTRTSATDWVVDNLPEGETILSNFQLLDLLPTDEAILRQKTDYPGSIGTFWQWLLTQDGMREPRFNIVSGNVYWRDVPDDEAQTMFIEMLDIRYLLVRSQVAEPTTDSMIAHAQQNGQLIASFCPGKGIDVAELPDDLFAQGWRQIWELQQPGPFVMIYDLALSADNPPIQRYCQ